MLPFRLTCLGTPQLFAPNGDPVNLRTRKNLALLTYLVIEPPVRHGRDRVAELLWPNSEMHEARHSLATALSLLRGKIGSNVFDCRRDSIRMQRGYIVTDVEELESNDDAATDLLSLETFLGDFAVHDSPSYSQWVDRERAHVLPLLQNRLARAIAEARANGDSELMARLALHLRRFDPLSEFAARTLLEARTMGGDRIGGLGEYERWSGRIADELGALPSRELSQLANRIRRDPSERVVSSRNLSGTADLVGERAFIGRGTEFQFCHNAWNQSAGGVPRHTLLLGDAGVGKSALAERVATVLSLEGANVAKVQSHAFDRELPFALVNQLVSQLITFPGASATPPSALEELARTVSAVSDRWPAVRPVPASSGEEARVRLIDALMALLSAIAEESPVVLICDDIHLADTASAVVLHSVLSQIDDLPLHALLTAASSGRDKSSIVETITTQPATIRAALLQIDPLPKVDSAALLDRLLTGSSRPSPALLKAMLGGARGNPLALTLLVSSWKSGGQSSLPLISGSMLPSTDSPINNRFRSLISGLIVTLDDNSRRVAELAAILGSRLDDFSFYSILELRPAHTIQAIGTLTNLRILREVEGKLAFSNELVRAECYHGLSAPIRQALHSLVADRLILVAGQKPGADRLDIAWHLVRANRSQEAVEFLLSGGREAIRRGAPHEAELAITTSLSVLDDGARQVATSLLAEALQELGRWDESLRVLGIPLSPSDSINEPWREVLRAVARRWGGDHDIDHLIATTINLLAVAKAPTSPAVRAGAVATLPYFLSHTRDELGLAGMGHILDEIERVKLPPYEQAQILLARAWWLERQGDRGSAAVAITKADTIVKKEGIGSTLAVRIAVGNGLLHSLKGRYQEAIPLLVHAVALAKRIENPVQIAAASASLATAYGRVGDYPLQIEWASQAISVLRPTDCSLLALAATYEQALGLDFIGRPHEAQVSADGLGIRCHRSSPPWALQAVFLMQADIAALAGDDRRAHALARKALAVSPRAPLATDLTGLFARWLARTAIKSGAPEAAINRLRLDSESLERLHSKDQSEVLASLVLLEDHAGLDSTVSRKQLGAKLAVLPDGVHRHLARLGFIALDHQQFGIART